MSSWSRIRPKIRLAFRWGTIAALAFLAIVAAAFWTMVLGGFAGSGFRAQKTLGGSPENIVVTSECAWPYRVEDQEAYAVCRMFYNLTPAQREEVLKRRR
jgi:hypothetical protein